jgi:hypothetical protein
MNLYFATAWHEQTSIKSFIHTISHGPWYLNMKVAVPMEDELVLGLSHFDNKRKYFNFIWWCLQVTIMSNMYFMLRLWFQWHSLQQVVRNLSKSRAQLVYNILLVGQVKHINTCDLAVTECHNSLAEFLSIS